MNVMICHWRTRNSREASCFGSIRRNNWVRQFHENNPFRIKECSFCENLIHQASQTNRVVTNMDVHSENTDSMFVNYVDPNASHPLVMFPTLQTDLISNSWQFQLLGQTPVPAPGPPGLQTINLPSGITLTPGTVLTLQNGQVSPHSGVGETNLQSTTICCRFSGSNKQAPSRWLSDQAAMLMRRSTSAVILCYKMTSSGERLGDLKMKTILRSPTQEVGWSAGLVTWFVRVWRATRGT